MCAANAGNSAARANVSIPVLTIDVEFPGKFPPSAIGRAWPNGTNRGSLLSFIPPKLPSESKVLVFPAVSKGLFPMSLRERWTVYPLLFLALGMILGGRINDDALDAQGRKVRVTQLDVVDEQGQTIYRLKADGWEPYAPPESNNERILDQMMRRLLGNKPASNKPQTDPPADNQ